MEELKLYCPLSAELFEKETEADWYEDVSQEALQLDGSDLSAFSELIQQALDREMDYPEVTSRGLAEAEANLTRSLNDDQKALLDQFRQCQMETDLIDNFHAFRSGFRLGAQIMMDVLSDSLA